MTQILQNYASDANQISSHDIFQRAVNVDIRTALREYYGILRSFLVP